MKKKHTTQSGVFRVRSFISMILCAAAICSMIIAGTLLAYWRSDASAKVSHRDRTGLTVADRVAYQRAIEHVYWRHRIWPNSDLIPSHRSMR